MKTNMLKKLVVIFTLAIICISNKKIYAISDNFKFVVDTIGIPRYNVYGKEINEEVYKAYNVFSYGMPEELSSDLGQRWKNSKYGLWSKGIGAYNGKGVRGEFNLLGKDYSGNCINNYYFPVDTLPSNTPEYWEYYSNPGAEASWNDKSKYKYSEQLEYMKNTKLLFNDISSRDNCDNPEKIKEYNITASKIGLSKARLDVCSTWKTNGIIHTRRKVGNSIRYAVFLTRPMAANADIRANIDLNDSEFILADDKDDIEVQVPYSANIINMAGYANKKHIKEIKSELYINGKKVDEISGSKTDIVGTKYVLKLTRKDLSEGTNYIKISNKSYSHTEFAVDGLMQNSIDKTINIVVQKKKIIPVIIENENIKVVEKDKDVLVVRPLAQFNVSKDAESLGISEAGKYLAIKLKVNENIKCEDIQKIKIILNDEEIKMEQVLKDRNDRNIVLIFRIPSYTNATVFGWKSLREIYGNYFSIDSNEVGKRINLPHMLDIMTSYNNEDYTVHVKFDTIDDYITNINYRYQEASLNDDKVISVDEWIEQ